MSNFSEEKYNELIQSIFQRFPSVQNVSFGEAYKPGLERMEEFRELLGDPDRRYRTIHIAGTNGKGSTASMLASALAACGLKVGVYTSPHILDFRERMRIVDGRNSSADGPSLVSEEYVYDFLTRYNDDLDRLQLSFFEITTGLAFKWFADMEVDWAVIETGLGGRLDSTNVITPELSVITSIGLDHCDLLGNTLPEIAAEKAGIIKKGVPVVVGGRPDEEVAAVFLKKAGEMHSRIVFADVALPALWKDYIGFILDGMDLRGGYQEMNLRTVLASLDVLASVFPGCSAGEIADAIIHTAGRTGFHGRWERISTCPDVICDIGHNAAALVNNFSQLNGYLDNETYSSLIIVYGVMADKNLDDILPLFPERATWIFTTPHTRRAMQA
ncbi:MAG: bifunctional folylpolyglutamate synthase/dihydrofolate synthase, partial [Candidatus Cryptobacteroides sp.]